MSVLLDLAVRHGHQTGGTGIGNGAAIGALAAIVAIAMFTTWKGPKKMEGTEEMSVRGGNGGGSGNSSYNGPGPSSLTICGVPLNPVPEVYVGLA